MTDWRGGALATGDARGARRAWILDVDRVTLARMGLVALAVAIPLQRAFVIGATGSAVTLLAVAVVPVALWAGLSTRDRRDFTETPMVLAAALAWWAGMTYFWSVDAALTSGDFVRLLPIVATGVAFWILSTDPRFQLRLLRAYLLGSVVASGLVIWQFLNSPAGQRASVAPDASINQVAFTLVLALLPAAYLLALALRSAPPGRIERAHGMVLLYGAGYSVLVVGILLSGSRSAALLTGVATLVAIVIIANAARTLLATVGGVVALVALAVVLASGLSLTQTAPFERAVGMGAPSIQEEARAGLLVRAWDMSAQRPLLGYGLGTGVQPLPSYAQETRNPHNTHMQVFLEMGAIGAALWILLMLAALRAAWERPPLDRLMWVSQLGLLFVGISTRGFIFGVPLWFLLGLVSALPPDRASRRRAMPASRLGEQP